MIPKEAELSNDELDELYSGHEWTTDAYRAIADGAIDRLEQWIKTASINDICKWLNSIRSSPGLCIICGDPIKLVDDVLCVKCENKMLLGLLTGGKK